MAYEINEAQGQPAYAEKHKGYTLSPRLVRHVPSFSPLVFFNCLPGINHPKNNASKAIRIGRYE